MRVRHNPPLPAPPPHSLAPPSSFPSQISVAPDAELRAKASASDVDAFNKALTTLRWVELQRTVTLWSKHDWDIPRLPNGSLAFSVATAQEAAKNVAHLAVRRSIHKNDRRKQDRKAAKKAAGILPRVPKTPSAGAAAAGGAAAAAGAAKKDETSVSGSMQATLKAEAAAGRAKLAALLASASSMGDE